MGRTLIPAVLVVLLASVGAALAAPAERAPLPVSSWVTDGDVVTVAATPGAVYVGGDFTLLGRPTGGWVEIGADGALRPVANAVEGAGDTAVSDGAGGGSYAATSRRSAGSSTMASRICVRPAASIGNGT